MAGPHFSWVHSRSHENHGLVNLSEMSLYFPGGEEVLDVVVRRIVQGVGTAESEQMDGPS